MFKRCTTCAILEILLEPHQPTVLRVVLGWHVRAVIYTSGRLVTCILHTLRLEPAQSAPVLFALHGLSSTLQYVGERDICIAVEVLQFLVARARHYVRVASLDAMPGT